MHKIARLASVVSENVMTLKERLKQIKYNITQNRHSLDRSQNIYIQCIKYLQQI